MMVGSNRAEEVKEDCHKNDVKRQSYNPLALCCSFLFFLQTLISAFWGSSSFVADVVVRGEQDGGQPAGEADERSVGLLLGLGPRLLRLPPELPGPQDGRDAPPEPLGRLPVPHGVGGQLVVHVLLLHFLWAEEGREGGEREGRGGGGGRSMEKPGVSTSTILKTLLQQ